jgi:hypothetical protein
MSHHSPTNSLDQTQCASAQPLPDIHRRSDSNVSEATSHLSNRSTHEEYLATLEVPSQAAMDKIAQVQQQREEERARKRRESNAAEMIQRNYRGYRERRALKGMGLTSSMRWVEVRLHLVCVCGD